MEGPKILGPPVARPSTPLSSPSALMKSRSSPSITCGGDEGDTSKDREVIDAGNDRESAQTDHPQKASPLWQHAQAFRHAATLGLLFDQPPEIIDAYEIFTNVMRHEGNHVEDSAPYLPSTLTHSKLTALSGGDYSAIAAAIEAGLFVPSSISTSRARARVRGGGGVRSRARYGMSGPNNGQREQPIDQEIISNRDNSERSKQGYDIHNNPITTMTSWLIKELSAPFSAIPTWHGMICTHLREQRERRLRQSQWEVLSFWERWNCILNGDDHYSNFWGRSTQMAAFDASEMDFDGFISGEIRVPSLDANGDTNNAAIGWKGNEREGNESASAVNLNADDVDSSSGNTVRVKAFAPNVFRDLRNRCFRVKESEYARSILNAIGSDISENCDGIEDDDFSLFENEKNIDRDLDSQLNSLFSRIIDDLSTHDNDTNTMMQLLNTVLQKDTQKYPDLILPYISFQSNSKGAARAGTFFFFTADGAYMIKTVKRDEAKAFLAILPEYHRFMSEGVNARNSLLTRVFGMYSVEILKEKESSDSTSSYKGKGNGGKWNGGLFIPSVKSDKQPKLINKEERVYLVMNSVFPSSAATFITERFDLKGSTVGRECSSEERMTKGANAVLKDLDLKREVENELEEYSDEGFYGDDNHLNRRRTGKKSRLKNYGIHIGSRKKAALMAQLRRDVDLLNRCGVLDYSLLVGVADMEQSIQRNKSEYDRNSNDDNQSSKVLSRLLSWIDFPLPYYGAGKTPVDGGNLSSLVGTRNGKQVAYYLGVIDFLQPWTVKKRLERDLKGLAGYDKREISCVAPGDYASRFLKFVDDHVT